MLFQRINNRKFIDILDCQRVLDSLFAFKNVKIMQIDLYVYFDYN